MQKKNDLSRRLADCSLFSGVDNKDVTWLLGQPGIQEKKVEKGSIIAFRGDVYDRLLIILEGQLNAELHDYRGRVLKVESIKQGEAVATAILFARDNSLPVSLIADSAVYFITIRKSLILAFMQKNLIFLENIIGDMGNRLSLLADKVFSLRFNTIRQKISAYVLDLSLKQNTDSPEMLITKEKLSEVFGVTRPALSRCFSELTQKGFITGDGKIIHILDRNGLEEIFDNE